MSQSAGKPEKILKRLEWTVIRRLDGLLQGDYRTLFHGFGLDLAEIREYQLHDDVRYIDWNVTARMQTPYVRQYNEDREVTAWFLMDISPSVNFGTVKVLKLNLLIDFAAIFSRLITRHGNRVGAVLYDGASIRIIPAHNGKLQVLHLLNTLLAPPERRHTPQTNLALLLETALRIIRRRSLIFIVSDFLSLPGWSRHLGMLAHRHETIAIRLFDPREVELPDIGPVFMEDAETGEQLYLDTHDRGFRRRFTEAAHRRETDLRAVFSKTGVDMLSLSTEDDLVREIVRFAALRKQRRILPKAAAGSRMK
ncbi:MAG: DUF58 domain-containing protein [Spirochaetales bacterium]|nr:MAG: DUF58 domain-containing protein [Spirochaetales bacterium]